MVSNKNVDNYQIHRDIYMIAKLELIMLHVYHMEDLTLKYKHKNLESRCVELVSTLCSQI